MVDRILDCLYTPRSILEGISPYNGGSMRSLLSIQVVLVLLGAAIAWYFLGDSSVSATLYGGAVALVNTILLSFRIGNNKQEPSDPRTTVMILYVSAIGRFVLVLVALAVGLSVFKFNPLPMLGMFIAAQLGYMIALLSSRTAVEPT